MKNYVNGINIPSARILGEYNCGAYGAGTYDGACTTGSNSGGSLADTGYNILLPLALGLALVVAAAILIVKRLRRRSNKSSK